MLSGVVQAQYSDIEALVEKVKEARLKDLLKQGIGYLHEGMHPADQDILHTLFQSGATQVPPASPAPVALHPVKSESVAVSRLMLLCALHTYFLLGHLL